MEESIFDRKTGTALAFNAGIAVGLALLTNLAIGLSHSQQSSANSPEFPPGWTVGVVWTLLFAGMGTARWLVATSSHPRSAATKSIVALILFCVAYPFYTGMLTNLNVGKLGNIATIIAALAAAAICLRCSRLASVLIVAVAGWTSFATFLIWRQPSL